MNQIRDKIISASRRTDIPGWYTPWFLKQIRQGVFTVKNPYNQVTRTVDVRPDQVHSIVFWSKNYGPFLDLGADQILEKKGYHLFFNFTLNAPSPLLEPGLPGIEHRLDQAKILCQRFGPDALAWRFDPICFFQTRSGSTENNLTGFSCIARAMAKLGVTRCITSFFDPYAKVASRVNRLGPDRTEILQFILPDLQTQKSVITRMADTLTPLGIRLHLCCEPEVEAALPDPVPGACIDGKHLQTLYGGHPETRKDYGQRRSQGCVCTRSIDIGSYKAHPCFHNCLFCYARTGMDLNPAQDPPTPCT